MAETAEHAVLGGVRDGASSGRARIRLAGVMIDNVSMTEAVERIESLISQAEPGYVVTPNADVMVKLHRDDAFQRIYDRAQLVVPDGMPLLWAARCQGTPLKERVAGSDFFIELCQTSARRGYRVFFLGAQEGVAARASEKLRRAYPGLQVVGTYAPPWGFDQDKEECRRIVEMIREARPQLLFVGLGSPKQEQWIASYYRQCGVPVSMAVGASFDFAAGKVRRAPQWMQRAGCEWFWRLMKEPARLWKRYLIDDPKFFWLVATKR